ncbi:MAG TPA: DUF2786 domain-containing protein [Acidimicrobiales bacterium]|nr:DUF2786 domain-containing protein [Acidimicrobiales bacterium]
MGKRNRERRAEKRRAEARAARRRGRPGASRQAPSAPRPGSGRERLPPPSLDDLILGAADAGWHGDLGAFDVLMDQLVHGHTVEELSCAVAGTLQRVLRGCWDDGWQPADLMHSCGRRLEKIHRRVIEDAVALESRFYRTSPGADPEWLDQLPAAVPGVDGVDDLNILGRWAGARGAVGVVIALQASLEVLAELLHLPRLTRLRPPPTEWGRERRVRTTRAGGDPKMAARVRALLAKAESTTFPAEAEALTVKAQELIAKHAIDRALLEDGAGAGSAAGVVGRRVLLDDPYASSKANLVAAIARANRCQAVWCGDLGFSTVFGHPGDVDSVELLHNSLLTQATAAMLAAGTAGARLRTRSFRSSFILAFAQRIGERLREATEGAVDDAREEYGDRLLPVLVAHDEAVKAARDDAFPNLKKSGTITIDSAGWAAGRVAADMAHLGPAGQLRAG